jgi:hypothetical protein
LFQNPAGFETSSWKSGQMSAFPCKYKGACQAKLGFPKTEVLEQLLLDKFSSGKRVSGPFEKGSDGALFQGDDPAPECFFGIVGGVFSRVPVDHCRFPLFPKLLLQLFYPPPAQAPGSFFDGVNPVYGARITASFPNSPLLLMYFIPPSYQGGCNFP